MIIAQVFHVDDFDVEVFQFDLESKLDESHVKQQFNEMRRYIQKFESRGLNIQETDALDEKHTITQLKKRTELLEHFYGTVVHLGTKNFTAALQAVNQCLNTANTIDTPPPCDVQCEYNRFSGIYGCHSSLTEIHLHSTT